MSEYKKCDYCNGDAHLIRIDGETAKQEVLCRKCSSSLNADKIDEKGVYIPLKLIKLLKEQDSLVIVESDIENLIKKNTRITR